MAYQKIKDIEFVDTELSGKFYRVYKNGTIVSLSSGKQIKQRVDKDGYSCFTAGSKNNRTCYLTHRVVGNLFLEKPNDSDFVKYELNHIDTDRTNPSVYNLEYVTHLENIKHSVNLGNYCGNSCEMNPNSKLTRDDVIKIKLLLNNGCKVSNIAKIYRCCWQTINHIKQGNTWKDVTIN